MMKRRAFVSLLGGAAAWPLAARAQQAERRIGILEPRTEGTLIVKEQLAGFSRRLETFGWSPDRNLHIDVRFSGGNPDRIPQLAKELIALKPELILALGTTAAARLQQQTRSIPIVFMAVSDPIGAGFVANLARPGGNMTGLLAYEEGITGKWLAMLKEISPALERAALLGNPEDTPYDYFLRAGQAAAPSLMIDVVPIRAGTGSAITREIEAFAREANGGLVILPGTANSLNADLIFVLAARYRLPAVYSDRRFATEGGLMSYGPASDAYLEAAPYVDRILRGAKPGELPVQTPTKYETIVNLKIARATGFEVPASLLVRADEVIE